MRRLHEPALGDGRALAGLGPTAEQRAKAFLPRVERKITERGDLLRRQLQMLHDGTLLRAPGETYPVPLKVAVSVTSIVYSVAPLLERV